MILLVLAICLIHLKIGLWVYVGSGMRVWGSIEN